MVLCIIGIGVFAVLGIFSAKYRHYFRESLKCIKKTLTLSPCEMGLEKRIRAKAAARLSGRPRLARAVYRHFSIISWIFVILLAASLFITAEAAYNIAVHGTCDPANPANCIVGGLGNLSTESRSGDSSSGSTRGEQIGCESNGTAIYPVSPGI